MNGTNTAVMRKYHNTPNSIAGQLLTTDGADTAISLQEITDETSARVLQTSFYLTQTSSSNSNTFL